MKKRRAFRILAAVGLCLAAGAFAGYASFVSPANLRPRIETALGRFLHAEVQVKGVEFSIWSGLCLDALEIVPHAGLSETKSGAGRFLLSQVRVRHAVLPLLTGRYRVRGILVEDLDARISQEARSWAAAIGGDRPSSFTIPRTRVAGGAVRLDVPGLGRPLRFSDFSCSIHSAGPARGVEGACRFVFSLSPEASSAPLPFSPKEWKLGGDAEGRFSLRPPPRPGLAPHISGQLTVSGISAAHPALAAKIKNGFARLLIRDKTLTLVEATADAGGGCIAIPTAGIELGEGGLQRSWARLSADSLHLPRWTKAAQLAGIGMKYRPEALSGRASGDLTIQWTPADGLDYSASMELADAAGAFPELEISFRGLDASLRLTPPGRLSILRARARALGGRVEAAGSFLAAEGRLRKPDLAIRLTGLSETGPMLRRLPERLQDFIGRAGLSRPSVSGELALRPNGAEAELSIHAEAAVLPDVPFRLEAPRAQVRWSSGGDRIFFENAEARLEGSALSASGSVSLSPGLEVDLWLDGSSLPLHTGVTEWLGLDLGPWEPAGAFDLELQARGWRPAGSGPAELLENLRVQAILRDVSLYHPEAGTVAEHIHGNVALDSKGARLSSVVGDFCGVVMHGGGRLPFGKGSQAPYLHLASETIILDQALYERLPFDFGIEKLGLGGQVSLDAILQGRKDGTSGVSATITALLHQVTLASKTGRLSASGSTRIELDTDFSNKEPLNPMVRGVVSLDRMTWGSLSADRLIADFDWHAGRIRFGGMEMHAYGGKIRLEETEIHAGDWQWKTTADLSHLDLESLLGAFGIEGRYAPSGNVRASLQMSGRAAEAGALQGNGTIKISRGRLYRFPLLVAVFNVLDLQLPSQSPVTDAYGDFRIRGGRLEIRDLLFSGGTVPAHLQGEIILAAKGGIKEKPIDLLVTVAKKKGILDRIPLLNWAKHYTIDYLRRLVFQAKVSGTLAEHEITTLSSPLTEPIRKMFSLLEAITPAVPEGD